MRRIQLAVGLVSIGLWGAVPAASQVRDDLETLGRALEGAVRQVSRASLVHGPGEGFRAYPLHGFGVVFVLSPRQLPAPVPMTFRLIQGRETEGIALEMTVRSLEEIRNQVPSEELRQHIERRIQALRRAEELAKARPMPNPQSPGSPAEVATAVEQDRRRRAELRRVEEQAVAMEREAAEAAADAEAAFIEVTRQLREGMTRSAPASAPALPRPPDAENPTDVVSVETPPWRSWLDIDEAAAPPTQDVVGSVRRAVITVLETRGSDLPLLRPEEHLAVAVDFFPRGVFTPRGRPERTLVIRARKQDLLDFKAGKLRSEELHRRIEARDY